MAIKIIGSGNIRAPEISASVLIDDTILIDCGHSVYKRLLQPDLDINKIKHVFITHLHSDHSFDLPALLSYYNFGNHDLNNPAKIQVFLPPGGIDILVLLATYALNLDEDPLVWLNSAADYLEYSHQSPIELPNHKVTPILVNHGPTKPAFGFIIKTPSHTIGLSGDSIVCPGIDQIVEESDILILDASNLVGQESHMGLNDVIVYANKYPNKEFYGTHLSNEARNSTTPLPPNLHLLKDDDII